MAERIDDPTLVGRIYKGDYENLRDDFQKIVARKIANKINDYKDQLKQSGGFENKTEE